MISLIHCIYASLTKPDFQEHHIPALLKQARESNRKHDITGMLLFLDGGFLQMLEGPALEVDAVYEIISRDPRHTQVTPLLREPIVRRRFSEWTMGFTNVERSAANRLIGTSDLLTGAESIIQLDGARARQLLLAFARTRLIDRTGTHRALGRTA
ncbi:MAG TPA: BLUF domain-containing protein [Steroidobacteraceae bacterium]|jgi:hypothetical protein|nr:BLUF domain-containing protein [Steroidobacteraceae bacterium]